MVITINQPYKRKIFGIANISCRKLAFNVSCKILNNQYRFCCKNCRGEKGNPKLNAKESIQIKAGLQKCSRVNYFGTDTGEVTEVHIICYGYL